MEYHSDRFEDASVIVKKGDAIVGLLPANKVGTTIHSHQGLTYGGFLLSRKQKLTDAIVIFEAILKYLESEGFEKLSVKQVPHFYTQQPSEELDYILHLLKAKTVRIDTASVIDYRDRLPIPSKRIRGMKKAIRCGLVIKEEVVFKDFWNTILVPNLVLKHQAKATHSLSEIKLLAGKFPGHIRQFNVYHNDEVIGGATIFETRTTAHVQYLSVDQNKQELRILDYLFSHLITDTFGHKKYFDFGISNENQGRQLNEGLSYWKECFGARTSVHRHFEVQTKYHSLLKDVLV